jgi:hypothetical protein
VYRVLSQSVALALLVGLSQPEAAEPPAAPSADAAEADAVPEINLAAKDVTPLFRAVRSIRDLAEFEILKLQPQETGAWIVAEIRPGGSSGGLYMQGGHIKAETGEFVDNGVRPSVVVQVGGQWKRLDLLSGETPPEGRFQWHEPHIERSFDRSFSIYDYYSVFTAANTKATVICQFFPTKSGAQQFASVTVIPDEWAAFVKPAYEYHVRHSADFAESDLQGLRKLASGENPFIALTALRQLLSRSTTAEEFDQLADLACSLPSYRQALLTYWLLKKNDGHARDMVTQAVSRTKSAAELRGLALGLQSWTATQGRMAFLSDPGSPGNLRETLLEKRRSFEASPAK